MEDETETRNNPSSTSINLVVLVTAAKDKMTSSRIRTRRRTNSLLDPVRRCFLLWLVIAAAVGNWHADLSSCQQKAFSSRFAVLSRLFACAQVESEEKSGALRKRNDQRDSGQTLNQILVRAGRRGLGGGVPGALAGIVQVVTLMWLRTIINYQARYGMTFVQALRTLLNEGGIGRLYRGLGFALIQAPLARFVSTAANDGVETLMGSLEQTKGWGPGRTTVVASIVVGIWRILLMREWSSCDFFSVVYAPDTIRSSPRQIAIDTMKVVLQVDSTEGFRSLLRRVKTGKISLLYQGSIATAVSAIMGHYPWFFTYNWLSTAEWVHQLLPSKLLRNAGIGLAASVVSDVVVNAIRVIKTTKQSLGSRHAVSYGEAVRIVLAADGWKGLFGRGLSTRIYANALQSIVFTIIWRGLAEWWRKRASPDATESSSVASAGD